MRARRLIIVALLIAALAAAVVWISSGHARRTVSAVAAVAQGAAEAWARDQLVAFANEHLVPEFAFDRFEYRYPATATFYGIRLVAEGQTILAASALRITLKEVPRRGQPVVLDVVEMVDPVLRLVEGPDGSLAGFDDLVAEGAGSRQADGGSTKLSDVLAMRQVLIRGGVFEFHHPEHPTMRIDGISMDVDRTPSPDRPGHYQIDGMLSRPPLLELRALGGIDLDAQVIEFAGTTLTVRLDEKSQKALPPAWQTWIETHQARGDLSVSVSGRLPLNRALESDLTCDLSFTDGNLVFDPYQLPVQSLVVRALQQKEQVIVERIDAELLGGKIAADANLTLAPPYPFTLGGRTSEVRLERLVPSEGPTPKYAGRVDLQAVAAWHLGEEDSLSGAGQFLIDQATLGNIDLVAGLLGVMGKPREGAGGSDRASARFTLKPGRIEFEDIELVCTTVAAHGEGEWLLPGALDVRFNYGPLERIQKIVPVVGDVVRAASDRVVTYRVSGTFEQPKFTVHPLGLGSEPPPPP